jgi:hypothetical protein
MEGHKKSERAATSGANIHVTQGLSVAPYRAVIDVGTIVQQQGNCGSTPLIRGG